jgi:hypothetical protein
MVVLASLMALLAGCGAPVAETGPTQQASQVTPAVTAEQPIPAYRLSPTAEPPTATSTVVPATKEPTHTNTPPPTATAVPPSPTPEPTATPVPTVTLLPTVTPAAALTAQDVQRITPAQAAALLDSGEALLYDVRSTAEYNTLHAAGALSFPDTDAAARYGELPADKSLIFY